MAGLASFWNHPFLSLKGTHSPAQGKPRRSAARPGRDPGFSTAPGSGTLKGWNELSPAPTPKCPELQSLSPWRKVSKACGDCRP